MSLKTIPGVIFVGLIIATVGSGFVFAGAALTGVLLFTWATLGLCWAFSMGHWIRYPLSGWMLAYLVWLWVVPSWSVIPHVSWLAAWVLMGLPLAYCAWGMTPEPDKVWRSVRMALLLAGPVFALWGVGQVVTGYGHGQPVGPLVDKNAFAALMNLFWFMASVRFIAQAHDRGWGWHLLLPAISLLLIAMTLFAAESRGAILTWLLLMPVMLWGGYRATHNRRVLLVVLAIALTGYLGAASILGLNVGYRTLNLEQDASANARLLLWKSATEIAQDHPLAGTGWGTFEAMYSAYRDPRENTTAGVYAHNDYLQIAAEGGVPALVLLLGIAVGLFFQLKRSLVLKHHVYALEATGLLLGALALFVHASLNFIFYFAFMNILAGLFMARAIQLIWPEGVGSVVMGWGRFGIGRATKGLITAFLVILIAGPLCLQLLSQVTLTGSQVGLMLLRSVWPSANAYEVAKIIAAFQPRSTIAQEILLQASEEALKNSAEISMEGVDFQHELLNEAISRYELIRNQTGNSPGYGVREARTLIQYRKSFGPGNAIERAREILVQNLRINPFHTDSMIELSRLEVLGGRPGEAQRLLAVFMRHVLSRRDQQLLAVEILRQRAAPRFIAELDTLEKQLKNVRSDSETGKALILPANFSENIDVRLEAIAKGL